MVFEAAGDAAPCALEGALARRPRRLNMAEPGQATFDADSYLADLVACIDELRGRGLLEGVTDVGVGCQWHSVVPLDAAGEPLGEVVSWADTRAGALGSTAGAHPEASTLGAREARTLGASEAEALRQRTGCAYAPLYWTYKVPWLMERASARRYVGLAEYVTEKLLGDPSMSVSMASGTGLLATQALDWDPEALELAGLSSHMLPPLASRDWRGQLLAKWQTRWPELAATTWHPVVGDGAAANLGAGCDRPGRAAVTVGTSAAVRAVREAPDPSPLPARLWRYVVDHSRVVAGAAFSSGGQVYRWALSLWERAGEPRFDVDMPVAAGSGGVGVLAWHAGARPPAAPVPAGEGVVFGLGLEHTGAHIVSAAAEAVCFELAEGFEALAGGEQLEVVAGGGALEGNSWWRSRLASALGRPVRCAAQAESTALGAACFALGARVPDPGGELVEPVAAEVAALQSARRRWERWRDAVLPLAAGEA